MAVRHPGPILMLLLATVVGCSAPAASRSPEASPVVAVAERDGVRVTLALEDSPPRGGTPTWARADVANLGDRPVRWAGGGCGHALFIDIDAAAAQDRGLAWPGRRGEFKRLALGGEFGSPASAAFVPEDLIRPPGQEVGCPAILAIETLAPGERLRVRARWDGTIAGSPAPPGPATVRASFPMIGIVGEVPEDRTDADPVVAALAIDIAGGGPAEDPALAPALAIDAALADPQFGAWVDAAAPETWINPDLVHERGIWSVGLFRSRPNDPQRREMFGQVQVDASGAVVGRRFD